MSKYVHSQLVAANPAGRDFALADLHGCYAALTKALGQVNFKPHKDRVFSVGDLIDRGPDSLACLRLLRQPWFHAVQGNHENMMISALSAGPASNSWRGWMANGGDWFEGLSSAEFSELQTLLPPVANLPIVITLTTRSDSKIGICHAQPPTHRWHEMLKKRKLTGDEVWRALWSRDMIGSNRPVKVEGVVATVHGHTIVNAPTQLGNMHFIDTGAYIAGSVSLIELNEAFVRKSASAVYS